MIVEMLAGIAALLIAAAPPPNVRMHGCPGEFRAAWDGGPVEAGPLRLVQVSCVQLEGGHFGASEAEVSPGGARIVEWQRGIPAPVGIAPLDGRAGASVPNRVSFRNFASGLGDAWG